MVIVSVVALVVRLAAQVQTAHVPTVQYLVGDAAGYWAWAERIANGAWIGKEAFYQAPLYPYVLGVLRVVGVTEIGAARFVQAVWGALACAMVAAAGVRLFDRRVGLIAGLMLGLYAPSIFYDGIIQKASLAGLLTCALMVSVGRCYAAGRRGRWVLLGVVVGLLCLTRENALVWLLVLIIWAFGHSYRPHVVHGLVWAALVFLGAMLVLVPVCVRNACVSGSWSLTTVQAGPNFYIGNSAEANGRYRPLVRGHETPDFERSDATRLAEAATGRSLSPGEVSRYWMDRAWSDVAAAPLRWLRLLGLKVLLTINAYEVGDVENLYIQARASSVLSTLSSVWHFGVLCPLGVVGLVWSWRRHRIGGVHALLLVSMIVAVAAFFVSGRYRYPLVPVLVVFAAFGAVTAVDAVRARRWRACVAAAVGMVALAIICNWPVQNRRRLDAMAAMNAGAALAQAGEVDRATVLFKEAVTVNPSSPEANNNLAIALAVQGRYGQAIPYYRRALAADPTLIGADYNLGVALEHVNEAHAALVHYRRAVELDPNDADARAAVARLTGNR